MDKKEKIKQDFGSHLQKLRVSKDLSIRKLASRSNLEYSQVQRIEQGKVNITLSTIHALAEGLEISTAELFTY
ncbi:Helix-turn-helix [Pedobacter terrae]|uniref:Helix-turn-helix n=1 Tax=Pedobacter terrae TaxID=405671 RepID=A0A1G7Q5T9_9SPHI|nr:helix-turn-helix transcriptional regulator [Pedobacter terrae]SDF93922.1 Helix-turn-helix [Pedobacter terrae]